MAGKSVSTTYFSCVSVAFRRFVTATVCIHKMYLKQCYPIFAEFFQVTWPCVL
uniref:Uncharacterized protein n=1 Tax=Anguilla anguilla TaxID=7936 RepID=A0A0E9RA33_ANGAN